MMKSLKSSVHFLFLPLFFLNRLAFGEKGDSVRKKGYRCHLTPLIVMVLLVLTGGAANAAQIANDTFTNGSKDGWSVGYTYYGWLYIDQDDVAYKTYHFGSSYANATLTVTFRYWVSSGWDSSDKFKVFRWNTKIEEYQNLSGNSYHIKTTTTTADNNGDFKLKFKPDSNRYNEYAAIDYVTIDTSNTKPIANPQSITTNKNTAVDITLTGSDADGDPLTYSVDTNPSHGSLSGTAPNLTYTPTSGYSGADSFTFKVNDGTEDSDPATVSITVSNTNNDYRPFTLRYREVLRGDMMTIGNTILVAPQDQSNTVCDSYTNGTYKSDTTKTNDSYQLCAYYNDPDANFPTTSAELPIPEGDDVEVAWAGLYWQALAANSNDVTSMQIKVKHDNSSYQTIGYDQLDWLAGVGVSGYVSYSAFKDITQLFKDNNWKAGNITIGNIPVAEGKGFGGLGTYGAWSLVIIYKKEDEKFRAINVYDGWQQVDSATPKVLIPIADFLTPKEAPISAKTSVFAAEGDKYIGNDYLKVKPSKKSTWTTLSHTSGQTFYSAINSSVNFSRSPNPINNQGIDIQNFDLGTGGKDIIEPQESKIDFKFGSDQDRYWPSMISFSAELRVPKLCYDYAYKQNERYFTEENDGSRDPRIVGSLYSANPVNVSLFIKNMENSDLTISQLKTSVKNIDTAQASYIDSSVKATLPGESSHHSVTPASSSDSEILDVSIGTLEGKESFYLYYDLDPKKYSLDMPIDASLKYDIILRLPDGSTLTLPSYDQKISHDIPLCVDGNYSYTPVYGTFNVEEAGLNKYNLYTQVAKRVDDFVVKSYNPTDNTSPQNISTAVAVELIDAGAFHETRTTCEEPDNVLTPRVWLIFDNQNTIPFNESTIQDAITQQMTSSPIADGNPKNFFAKVRRNAAFRVSYNKDNNGSLVTFSKLSNGDYKLNNFPSYGGGQCDANFSATHPGATISHYCGSNTHGGGASDMNKSELAECMECLYGYNIDYVCSRDNFAIRPEAFKVSLTDDNTTSHNTDFANNTGKAGTQSRPIKLAAGYPYRFDINATSYIDEIPVQGYAQLFDANDADKRAYMKWNSNKTGCNAPDDINMSFALVNGTNTNANPINTWEDRHDALSNVGEYRFKVIDQKWTQYDWDPTLLAHHTGSHFIDKSNPDCITDSNDVNATGKVGCETSSIHKTQYKAVAIRAYPYDINISTVDDQERAKTFYYTHNLATNSHTFSGYGASTNQAAHIAGTIRPESKDHKQLNNFVRGCYAENIDFSFVPSDKNASGVNGHTYPLRYREVAATGDSNDITQTVTIPATMFTKENNGTVDLDLYLNFDRSIHEPTDPVKVNITTLSADCSPASTCQTHADGIDNHNATYLYRDFNASHTFYYARAKSSQFFYDNITTNSAKTPLSIVAYSNDPTKMGSDFTPTNEFDWYIANLHGSGDGSISLVTTSSGTNITNPGFNHGEANVTVSYTGSTRPHTANINLTGTDPWLIYNDDANDSLPSPFYKVRFINVGNWTGYGKTGHVVGDDINTKKSKRVEW